MKEYILELCEKFLSELRLAPSLGEDMASMERILAESYSNRSFMEMIQNADDAQATKICLLYANDNLYVANNGHSFTKEDVLAICRSGASSKERGLYIGYRGVGFKSTTCFSDNITIVSGETAFSFSKSRVASVLNLPINKVPTVRVPLLDNSFENDEIITELKDKGFSTVFIFHGSSLDLCETEVNNINGDSLIFLNSVSEVTFAGELSEKKYVRVKNDGKISIYEDGSYVNEYKIIQKDLFSIALPMLLKSDENVFHCFLPTIDETGYKMRINANFTTDPTRKHINLDSQTSVILETIAKWLTDEIVDAYNGKESEIPQHIEIFENNSKPAQELESFLITEISTRKWLNTINGELVTLQDGILMPNDTGEIVELLRLHDRNSKFVWIKDLFIRKLLTRAGMKQMDENTLQWILFNKVQVKHLSNNFYDKLLSGYLQNSRMTGDDQSWKDVYLRIGEMVEKILTILNDSNNNKEAYDYLARICDKETIKWIQEQLGIHSDVGTAINAILKRKRSKVIPKWRTAEQI